MRLLLKWTVSSKFLIETDFGVELYNSGVFLWWVYDSPHKWIPLTMDSPRMDLPT
jgi:hypothetical protein